VLNRQRGRRVGTAGLAAFLRRARRLAPAAGPVVVALVSDPAMRRLNRRYRGRDATTDVLSFPAAGDDLPAGEAHLGDIAISVATAERQARGAGHTLARELKLLALHGYLHLLGHDHATDGGRMLRIERRLARRLLDGARGAPGA